MEKSVLELFLPEGILEYFDIQSTAKTEEGYMICLAEKNLQPLGFKGEKLSSKGYLDEVTIKDFPIRGKACYLKVRRRRWINEDTGEIIPRSKNFTETSLPYLTGKLKSSITAITKPYKKINPRAACPRVVTAILLT